MKVLWIVNTIFPYPSQKLGIRKDPFGGWLVGLVEQLIESEEIELAIATVYTGKELKKLVDGKTIYYLIPGAPALNYKKSFEEYWKKINEDFEPELVHIHGTEFTHGLAFIKACPNTKNILSIQGLTSVCSEVYYANITPLEILKNITLRDLIKKDTIFDAKKKMQKRGIYEKELIKKCNNIIGRTTWDYDNVKSINPNVKYYKVNETLRSGFYNQNWNYEEIEKNSIFFSQAGYPIKGLHIMLKALPIIKEKFPDVKLYVAGEDFVTTNNFKQKLRQNGYGKYINSLIKKNNLQENVIFTGTLSESEMIERYKKSNIFVCTSVVENESNSLSEASIIGLPSVCSYVGGLPDRVENNVNGLLYPYTEYRMLAQNIIKYLENTNLVIEHGKRAKEKAIQRNNPEKNSRTIIEIYKEVINEGEKNG